MKLRDFVMLLAGCVTIIVILSPGEMWKSLREGRADAWAALLVTVSFFWAVWLWYKNKKAKR